MTRLVRLPLGREEERLLAQRVREGDAGAFESLYQHFAPRAFGLALTTLGEQGAAEDAVQEVFLRVFRSLRKFRGDAGLATWIHRITVNVCNDELERRRRRGGPPANAASPSGERSIDGSGTLQAALDMARLLARLEPVKRVTFYLHHAEGLSAAEIAEVLDDSRDAVLKRLQRTRRELIGELEPAAPGSREAPAAAGEGRR